ncbi:MAG: serine/threonine protein kinase, partial [Planctomycetes bacterium]|nr:serine/threonine protein kinase [Planctomycetota bacterium]
MGQEDREPEDGRDHESRGDRLSHLPGYGSNTLTGGIDELIEDWLVRYCPVCNTRYPASTGLCAEDGTPLRDCSVSLTRFSSRTTFSFLTEEFLARCPKCGTFVSPAEEVCPRDGTPVPSEEEPLDLPCLVGEKWKLLEYRGGGSFGRFYLGEHHILGMKVGVKILRSRLTATKTGRRLFHQEAMRLSRINHPNIVKVFDYGEEDGKPFLVMEYLRGEPLHHFLQQADLSIDEDIEVVRQTALALQAAHRGTDGGAPLVHLDLKPEHIFLDRVGQHWDVKVIDFGIAEIVSPREEGTEKTPGGERVFSIAGTPPYMGPERFQGIVDHRSDIYSLGVILYELVAGRKPFDTQRFDLFQKLHETKIPEPPSRFREGRPSQSLRKLDSIVLWCLEKKPEDRPENAEKLLEKLEEWQAERVEEKRGGWHRLLRRWSAAIALTLLTVTLAVYWGPFERITRPEGARLTRPPVGETISAEVAGVGYSGAKVFISYRWREETRRLELPGAFVQDGRIEAKLPSVEDFFDAASLDPEGLQGHVEARIIASGPLWREVRSEPFALQYDLTEPEIDFEAGEGVLLGQLTEKRGLILMSGEKEVSLFVRANKALQAAECRIEGAKLEPLSTDPTRLGFNISPGTEALEVALVDTWGNRREERWQVTWVGASPRLPSAKEFFTNQSSFSIPLEFDRPCGKLEVLEPGPDGKLLPSPEQVKTISPSQYSLSLEFSQNPQTRDLTVRSWP